MSDSRTPINLAVLSNSHAATLKNAFNSKDYSNVIKATFFARPEGLGGVDSLRLENGILVPGDAGLEEWFRKTAGRRVIDLGLYDLFWIHGLEGPDSHSINGYEHILTTRIFSQQFKETYLNDIGAAMHAHALASQSFRFAKIIRSASQIPLLITSKPFHVSSVPINVTNESVCKRLSELHASIMKSVYKEIDCEYISQPVITRRHYIHTDESFALSDGKHMNKYFGIAYIDELLISQALN